MAQRIVFGRIQKSDEVRWKTRGEGRRVGDREEAGVTDPLKET
jgi:hypothetical protein